MRLYIIYRIKYLFHEYGKLEFCKIIIYKLLILNSNFNAKEINLGNLYNNKLLG